MTYQTIDLFEFYHLMGHMSNSGNALAKKSVRLLIVDPINWLSIKYERSSIIYEWLSIFKMIVDQFWRSIDQKKGLLKNYFMNILKLNLKVWIFYFINKIYMTHGFYWCYHRSWEFSVSQEILISKDRQSFWHGWWSIVDQVFCQLTRSPEVRHCYLNNKINLYYYI